MREARGRLPVAAWGAALEELGYRPPLPSVRSPVDFTTADGSLALEVKERGGTAVRDLRSALTQLGFVLKGREEFREACLLLVADRLTASRVRDEWEALRSILREDVADRLALVVVGDDYELCLPADRPDLVRLAAVARRLIEAAETPALSQMPRQYVILKILLVRWLLREGPISRKELGDLAGCSYPTVAKTLSWLGAAVRQGPNRSVELAAFPQAAWSELLALAPGRRARLAYVDRSGRPADSEGLLRRLERIRPDGVALGGVAAARHWNPHFDLRGWPRLDLSVHAAETLDLGFLRRLDPALRLATEGSPVLVLHPVQRPASLFASASGGMPIADPVETLLDLSELRLVEQAGALIDRFERTHRAGA